MENREPANVVTGNDSLEQCARGTLCGKAGKSVHVVTGNDSLEQCLTGSLCGKAGKSVHDMAGNDSLGQCLGHCVDKRGNLYTLWSEMIVWSSV